MGSEFIRKRNRVKYFDYSGSFAYFITICTKDKLCYFDNAMTVNDVLSGLKLEADKANFIIYAYCFMPDHLHLLMIGRDGSNLINFIKLFKQKTAYYFKQKTGASLWQKSYYDHLLRENEAINGVAGYIFENPLRKKLTNDIRDYAFSGSFVFDIKEFYEVYDRKDNLDIGSLIERNA
jgi:putative transposase